MTRRVVVPELVRPAFAPRQLVSAADLEALVAYTREQARRHNRLLHGWGVVAGLDVTVVRGAAACVRVAPGLALDPCGNELALAGEASLPLPAGTDDVWVVARYAEESAVQVPAPDGGAEPLVTRLRERLTLDYARQEPKPDAADPCAGAPSVPLARLRWTGKHWRLERRWRPRRVR